MLDVLAPACRKHGIRRVRIGEMEIEFGGVSEVDEQKVKAFQAMLDKGLPSEDEVLFHSAPGYSPPEANATPVPAAPLARNRRKE